MHIRPEIARPYLSRQAARKASGSCGRTPAFCGSAPVLISTKRSGRRALPGDLLGQRLAQAVAVDRVDRVEQRDRILRLVRLQRADEMQFDARVPAAAAAISPSPPARGSRRTRAGRRRSPARSRPAPNVFDTATRVTSAGSRLASRQARSISVRTCSRLLEMAAAMRCLYRTVSGAATSNEGPQRSLGDVATGDPGKRGSVEHFKYTVLPVDGLADEQPLERLVGMHQ